MLDAAHVIAFVATARPAEARRFYEDVLGLRLFVDEPFALAFEANGVMLRISKVERFDPQPFTVLGWAVEDIEAAVDRLSTEGVRFECYEGLDADARGICTFPGGARAAWFKDPDGNTLSITQVP